MAYANHVSHVISILCAIKKFNYLFHLLMKLICWFGFLLFHSLLSSWLSCSFFFHSFSLLLSYLSCISLKPPQLKFSRGNIWQTNLFACSHSFADFPISSVCMWVCARSTFGLQVAPGNHALLQSWFVSLFASKFTEYLLLWCYFMLVCFFIVLNDVRTK